MRIATILTVGGAVAALVAGGMARAACPTAPTGLGLTGNDASSTSKTVWTTSQTLGTVTAQFGGHLAVGWNGTAPGALNYDASCSLDVDDLNLNTAVGTTADTAWTSGAGTLIAIAKTTATNTGAGVATPGGTYPTNIIIFGAQDSVTATVADPVAINHADGGVTTHIQNTSLPATSVTTSSYVTPTVSTSAYVTGYVLGGIMSFASQPTTGAVANAAVTFNSGSFSAGTVDVYLFNASPTGGGTTDHAAFALTSTDTGKFIGVLHLNDCTSFGGVLAQCQALYQSQFYTLAASGTTIYAVAEVRGAPIFAGSSDVTFSINVVK